MKRSRPGIALLALLLVSLPVLAIANSEIAGSTDGGAFYKIVVPDPWNGDLVIWNHGFSLAPPARVNDLGPIAELQLFEGYAVAASSYQQAGWALFKSRNDLENLVGVFKEKFGTPKRLFLTGGSLGGLVTIAAIEDANLGNVVGAFPFCGAVAGSRNWDAALDLRLVYDAVCGGVTGAAIPGGAEGLPSQASFTQKNLAAAVDACTGILTPPASRTSGQNLRLRKILDTLLIPENFLLTDMGYVTFGMSDLVHDPRKLSGKIGMGNAGVDYGDPAINASIKRVVPNPGAANRLGKNYTPTGNVGKTKIVSLHTDKDGLVLVENEGEYAKLVPAGNLTTAIVVEGVPTHCGFTKAETVAGWESLRAWVGGAAQPTAASIKLTCDSLLPAYSGPCRIDPGFVIPDMDGRIRPR
ncbi:hypothetical protein [Candidatus Deferrimicrobium sp.]|uniref:hypothetical protein n=1 Tax=Candidatus Deferrimicrobium sp. TaxID=3060586 RepID=UPI002ED2CEA1